MGWFFISSGLSASMYIPHHFYFLIYRSLTRTHQFSQPYKFPAKGIHTFVHSTAQKSHCRYGQDNQMWPTGFFCASNLYIQEKCHAFFNSFLFCPYSSKFLDHFYLCLLGICCKTVKFPFE